MPDFCAAYGCSNERNTRTRSRGITFHRFPKDSGIRRQWERAVKRKDFVANKRSLLCSEHFQPEDFDRTGQIVQLRHGVKPSVFNFPSNLKKQVPSKTTKIPRKAEESLPVDLPQRIPEAKPRSDVDHNYALPASPTVLKARLNRALARVESLEREKRNSKLREQRMKKNVHALLEDLREKSLIIEELKDVLECYSGKVPRCQNPESGSCRSSSPSFKIQDGGGHCPRDGSPCPELRTGCETNSGCARPEQQSLPQTEKPGCRMSCPEKHKRPTNKVGRPRHNHSSCTAGGDVSTGATTTLEEGRASVRGESQIDKQDPRQVLIAEDV